MNAYVTSILLSISSFTLWGQNIVDNPSFSSGNLSPWYSILSVDNYYGYPNEVGQEGRVYTSDGNGCVGVRFYAPNEPNWQEYIYQNISNEMQWNTVYEVSVKYRLAPRCRYATDAMGVGFFSDNTPITSELLRTKIPEIKNTPGNLLENNNEFHEFLGHYTANSAEVYFAFGAFAADSNMLREMISLGPPYANAWEPEMNGDLFEHILYYIDEVSIKPCFDYPDDVFVDQEIFCSNETVELTLPDIANATFLWSTGETTPSIEVLADNQTVSVDIMKNGCRRHDSIELKVFSGGFDVGNDTIICESKAAPMVLHVNPDIGETLVWNDGSTKNKFTVNTDGDYWVTKSLGDCSFTDTINVQFIGDHTILYPNPYGHTFTFSEGDDVWIKEIVTEDGKYLFKGYETLATVKGLLESLPSGQFYISAEINGCAIEDAVIKISMP